jgi:molybdenum cofactor guanylyltransferase
VGAIGVVLTGGQSRRFGSPKALVRVEGEAMALRVATALHDARCPTVIAVGSIGGLAEIWTVDTAPWRGEIVDDLWPGEGPLSGVLSAMARYHGDIITAACDLAWLDGPSVGSLLQVATAEAYDAHPPQAVFGVRQGQMVPVIWWSQHSRSVIDAAFRAGERSLYGVLKLLNVRTVEFSANAARSVTTPADLEQSEHSDKIIESASSEDPSVTG